MQLAVSMRLVIMLVLLAIVHDAPLAMGQHGDQPATRDRPTQRWLPLPLSEESPDDAIGQARAMRQLRDMTKGLQQSQLDLGSLPDLNNEQIRELKQQFDTTRGSAELPNQDEDSQQSPSDWLEQAFTDPVIREQARKLLEAQPAEQSRQTDRAAQQEASEKPSQDSNRKAASSNQATNSFRPSSNRDRTNRGQNDGRYMPEPPVNRSRSVNDQTQPRIDRQRNSDQEASEEQSDPHGSPQASRQNGFAKSPRSLSEDGRRSGERDATTNDRQRLGQLGADSNMKSTDESAEARESSQREADEREEGRGNEPREMSLDEFETHLEQLEKQYGSAATSAASQGVSADSSKSKREDGVNQSPRPADASQAPSASRGGAARSTLSEPPAQAPAGQQPPVSQPSSDDGSGRSPAASRAGAEAEPSGSTRERAKETVERSGLSAALQGIIDDTLESEGESSESLLKSVRRLVWGAESEPTQPPKSENSDSRRSNAVAGEGPSQPANTRRAARGHTPDARLSSAGQRDEPEKQNRWARSDTQRTGAVDGMDGEQHIASGERKTTSHGSNDEEGWLALASEILTAISSPSERPSQDNANEAAASTSSSTVEDNSDPSWYLASALILALVAALLFGAWLTLGRPYTEARREAADARAVEQIARRGISGRGELIQAFHRLALQRPYGAARWWHHRRVAQRIIECSPESQQALDELISLYVQARYLPAESELTAEQIARANTAYRECAIGNG